MAAASDPDEVLRSTDGKTNFQRLARLLISGGTSLLREEFDAIHPPSYLPTVLSCPATKIQLKAARLTKPQWDCLYPSPGVYGMSAVFDISLLFRLLMTICSLIPPPTGWNALPASTDHSLTADLVRIKYYRNSVYGHVSQKMEIPDDQFLILWPEISNPLVRIAAQISLEKKTAWQKAIDNFLNDPLTADDDRNVRELERWYKNDMDVKKSVEELKTTTQEGIDRLETMAIDFYWDFVREAQHFRADARDTKIQLQGIFQLVYRILISSFAGSQSTGADQSRDVFTDTEGPGTHGSYMGINNITQLPQAVAQSAIVALVNSNQPQALITTSIPSTQDVLNTVAFKYFQSVDPSKTEELNAYLAYVEKMHKVLFNRGESGKAKKILKELLTNYRTGQINKMAQTFLAAENLLKEHGLIEENTACRQGALKRPGIAGDVDNRSIPSAQDVLNIVALKYFQSVDPSKPEELNAYLEYVEKMRKVLFNHDESVEAIKIIKELLTNYRTGQVNEMTQTILVAENFLKEHGLIEEHTAYRQGALKHPVTYPASMENEDHASDLPKNQESLNFIAQLQKRCVELYNTLLGWIRITVHTIGEQQSLTVILCKCPRNVFMACVNLVRIAVTVVLIVSSLIVRFTFQVIVTYSFEIMYSC